MNSVYNRARIKCYNCLGRKRNRNGKASRNHKICQRANKKQARTAIRRMEYYDREMRVK